MENQIGYELKVIGAGLPRTGTLSLKKALEILGFNCYHMLENFKNNDSQFWSDAFENKTKDYKQVFKNYTATVDSPACFCWKDLLDENQEAKVILSVRDNSDVWYKSYKETVLRFLSLSGFGANVNYILFSRVRVIKKLFDVLEKKINKDPNSKKDCIEYYESFNQDVIEKCPKEKLLVFNVKEGWEPLCNFLNVPIPDCEFPRVNDTNEFNWKINAFVVSGHVIFWLGCILLVIIAYYCKFI